MAVLFFFIRRRKDESFIRSSFIEENAFPLIDEPTNHLDLAGRQQVAEYLKKKTWIYFSQPRSGIC